MKKSLAPELRKILREHPDGLTVRQILGHMLEDHNTETMNTALNNMPDTYIDRWVVSSSRNNAMAAVWVAVHVPENCPHPTGRYKT